MARIALERAPPAALPRRFLLTAPLWGVVAGTLLIVDGTSALESRWAPTTLALTHVFTLGVLGNAMFGSLLQFLPAAAGTRVHGGVGGGWTLHALLNAGALALVIGLHGMWPDWLLVAGALLAAAFVLLAVITVPGLLGATGQRLLRAGIGASIAAALVTSLLGIGLLLGLTGWARLAPLPWTDLHAAWGVLGWMLVLIASVMRVVMPMFQGTSRTSSSLQLGWLLTVGVLLLVATVAALCGVDPASLRCTGAAVGLTFAAAGLWLQWCAPRPRNPPLLHCWRAGLLALAAASLVLGSGGDPLLAGVLAIAIGLPLLVQGMALEIVAFLGWIDLQRRSARGVRVPGVQQLLPGWHKTGVLIAQLGAALALVTAVVWSQPWLARMAGVLVVLAHGMLWLVLRGAGRRGDLFLQSLETSA